MNYLNLYHISLNDIVIGKTFNSNMIIKLENSEYNKDTISDNDSILDLCELLSDEKQTILAKHLSNFKDLSINEILSCSIFNKYKNNNKFKKEIPKLNIITSDNVNLRNCVKIVVVMIAYFRILAFIRISILVKLLSLMSLKSFF